MHPLALAGTIVVCVIATAGLVVVATAATVTWLAFRGWRKLEEEGRKSSQVKSP